ncbi:hypothetical protein [Streptomyces stackebrandtii]|uniref:hypothetical protein n=1 Tax=Streptomyces stackebrandtii TaxID=3051177 RepID=UPI0028DC1D91|nr:hypothetical protein [Streptomyces sp. DSM 40976]
MSRAALALRASLREGLVEVVAGVSGELPGLGLGLGLEQDLVVGDVELVGLGRVRP